MSPSREGQQMVVWDSLHPPPPFHLPACIQQTVSELQKDEIAGEEKLDGFQHIWNVWIIMIALNGLEWIDWLHVKNMGKLHRRAVSGLDSWKILDSRSSRARIFSFCLLKPDPRHLMAFSPPINVHLEAYRNINCFCSFFKCQRQTPSPSRC